MNRTQLETWVEELRRAWEQADSRRAGALFTVDAEYHSHPFQPPLVGRDAIEGYWKHATATQANIRVRMGKPLLDGDRAVVEWWAFMTETGAETTDAGALVLEFAGEHCRRLREYWNMTEGFVEPPEGWAQ
jgi:ketosteroid isomerase-like protein